MRAATELAQELLDKRGYFVMWCAFKKQLPFVVDQDSEPDPHMEGVLPAGSAVFVAEATLKDYNAQRAYINLPPLEGILFGYFYKAVAE